jgi:crotonobetainyl-CoA:carnitine CoA-transferase CaiB-like acyl-CoA transferase
VKNTLRGVRVLDFSSVMMGPYASQMLADQGADVVCVEGPQISTQRQLGPGTHPELSGIAVNLLRNKRSVQLDLRTDHGRRAFLALAASCDIVITNLRASSLAKLGVAYDEVARVHPGVVWCEAHGHSPATGDPDAPMYDDIAQAAAGLPHLMVRAGLTDEPRFLPTVLADKVCAFAIAEAVLAGLVQRSRTGTGLRIELAMVEVMRSFVLAEHCAGAVFEPEVGAAGYARVLAADRRPHATADGYVAAMPYSPADWRSVFRAFARDDLAEDDRLASHRDAIVHAPELYASLGGVLRDHSTAECLRRFAEAGVACSPLATLEEMLDACELLDHPVAGRYRYLPTGITSNSPDGAEPVRSAPLQGEHTASALRQASVAEDDVAACLADLERTRGR